MAIANQYDNNKRELLIQRNDKCGLAICLYWIEQCITDIMRLHLLSLNYNRRCSERREFARDVFLNIFCKSQYLISDETWDYFFLS